MSKIKQLRKRAFNAQNGICCYCGNAMWETDEPAFRERNRLTEKQSKMLQCTAEHLVARQDGGKDAVGNIAAACLYCNRHRHAAKVALPPDRYKERVGREMAAKRWHQIFLPAAMACH